MFCNAAATLKTQQFILFIDSNAYEKNSTSTLLFLISINNLRGKQISITYTRMPFQPSINTHTLTRLSTFHFRTPFRRF